MVLDILAGVSMDSVRKSEVGAGCVGARRVARAAESSGM